MDFYPFSNAKSRKSKVEVEERIMFSEKFWSNLWNSKIITYLNQHILALLRKQVKIVFKNLEKIIMVLWQIITIKDFYI